MGYAVPSAPRIAALRVLEARRPSTITTDSFVRVLQEEGVGGRFPLTVHQARSLLASVGAKVGEGFVIDYGRVARLVESLEERLARNREARRRRA